MTSSYSAPDWGEQVEDVDEPGNAAVSTELETFFHAHIENRDVVHASRARCWRRPFWVARLYSSVNA